MIDDQSSEHFEALMAAEVAVNDHELTPEVIEDAQRALASRAAKRLVNKLGRSRLCQTIDQPRVAKAE